MLKIASLNCTHQYNWSPEERITVVKYGAVILILETEDKVLSFRISIEDIKQVYRLVLEIYKGNDKDKCLHISNGLLEVYPTTYGDPFLNVLRVDADTEDVSIDVDLSQVLRIFENRKRRK
jgi:hypothetical protein